VGKNVEILIVEDSPTQAEELKYILEQQRYQVTVAKNGKEAVNLLNRHNPAIIISDVMMPEMDGYQLCKHIKTDQNLKNIPVILLTTLSDPQDVITGLQCGADNFVTKPYDKEYLMSRINHLLSNMSLYGDKRTKEDLTINLGLTINFGNRTYTITSDRLQILNLLLSTYETAVQKNQELIKARDDLRTLNEQLEQKVLDRTAALRVEIAERIRAEEALQQSYGKLKKTLEATAAALTSALEKRDPYTAGHQQRVARLACLIAQHMGLSEDRIEGIHMAGILHDIGKIAVPGEILSKPGKLSEVEFLLIQSHSMVGYEILRNIEFPWPIAKITLQHHERMDGSGYPEGLSGVNILLEARILAVADVIEAISSHRPYRPTLSIEIAIKEISQDRGTLYDPDVVDAALKLLTKKEFNF